MAISLDPEFLAKAVISDRWSVAARTGLSAEAFATWDPQILRKPRLIVPVDVQALYVGQGSSERFVQLPGAVTTPDGADAAPATPPFAAAKARPSGVHLHWAMPDSIMRGTMQEAEDDTLGLAALPDRWLVLRILAPIGADRTQVRGWVIEADTTRVVPLADWREGTEAGSAPTGRTLSGRELNAAAGGSVSWTASYDATLNRFGMHDSLQDLSEAAPDGVFANAATYLVAGWWSRAAEDPLDGARNAKGFAQVIDGLGWRVGPDTAGQTYHVDASEQVSMARAEFGIESASRFAIVPTTGTFSNSTALSGAAGQELFLPDGGKFVAVQPRHIYSTLLHGVVHGVPVTGRVPADNRPAAARVSAALAGQAEDGVAALVAAGLDAGDGESRRDTERLIAALSADLVGKLGEANGAVEIEEREHAANFSAVPGEDSSVERIVDRGGPEDLIAGRAARNRAGTPTREVRSKSLTAELTWSSNKPGLIAAAEDDLRIASGVFEKSSRASAAAQARNVRRPGPRYYTPLEPVVTIRNAKRSLRHRRGVQDGPDATLMCRWPSQVAPDVPGGISGRELLGSFPYGAIPQEVVRLAQNAIITDPYAGPWVADSAANSSGVPRATLLSRIKAETALRFTKDGVYDGTVPGFAAPDGGSPGPKEAAIGDQLRRHSLIEGVDAAPVGVTVWAQPWSPIWFEWEVELDIGDRLTGWTLGQVDYETGGGTQTETRRTIRGRSPVSTGAARALFATVGNWIEAEDLRDSENGGEADDETEREVSRLFRHLEKADMMTATLSGLHDALLGLPEAPDGRLEADGTRIAPVDLPMLLFSGRMRLTKARIVDAFGRVLQVDTRRVIHPAAASLEQPKGFRLPPRLSRPARLSFRLADPGDPAVLPREATVNQERPDLMVNPVAGFLLPDLIDEALELFDTNGEPLGQLMHEPISGGVMWEIAPGREGPADSGPLHDLQPEQLPLGRFAAAMVEADARARQGSALTANAETSLSAFLRAVDTTLWSIDAFATLGTPHIAGLVGRPMAVVRATLRLQIRDDLAELDLSAPGALEARKAVYDDLADRAFTVRVGEFTRDDDGVYGYFVNDDFARFHLVDKLVQNRAVDAGRRRGHFGLLGQTGQVPEARAIEHPYIVAEDELAIHAGEIIRLTILMHPSGKVHLTSGILPRKSLQLARDWVDTGLARMAPSARIGPVLIDPDKVRLPRIASFGQDQTWTRRDTPFTWKDDPILAATQTALLPDAPAGIEEGYVRIAATNRPANE